jgi:small subunit ribosomal protein S3
MEKGAQGIKVKVGGRLNGAEIARKETFKEWNIPTQTIRSNIDYSTMRAETVYGTIGLKVWIYKGDIYKKSKKLDS